MYGNPQPLSPTGFPFSLLSLLIIYRPFLLYFRTGEKGECIVGKINTQRKGGK